MRGRSGPIRLARVWRWLTLAPLLLVVAFDVLLLVPPQLFARALMPLTNVGVDDKAMQAAVNAAGWPQQSHTWCGVATIAAIANYRGYAVSQASVANFLNTAPALSVWGTPSWNGTGPGFTADISRDGGSDPRALAEGMSAMAGGTYRQMVDQWGAWDATAHLAADIEYSRQPISVIVDHGQHSVVVSKVYANGDPASNPGSIYALEVWDPGVGSLYNAGIQQNQVEQVPIGTWLGSIVYWGESYNSWLDPDPSVGPYNGEALWTGHFVYIRPGGVSGASVDWALNQDWLVIAGAHGELPPGYAYPTPTPTPTPPPQPTRAARPAPTSAPTSQPTSSGALAAVGGPSPAPTSATSGTDLPLGAQSLCTGASCLQLSLPLWWALSAAAALVAAALLVAVLLGSRSRAGPTQAGSSAAGIGASTSESPHESTAAQDLPAVAAAVAVSTAADGESGAHTPGAE